MNEFNEFENAIDHQLNIIENNQDKSKNKEKELSLNTPFYDKDIVKERTINLNGELKITNYVKGKFIGKGGFAKCYEFLNLETNGLSAVKIIEKSTLGKWRSKQKLISEIKIHRSLDNPYIVKFQHFFEDSENVYLLLEICHNQSLNELLKRRKRLTEFEAQFYLFQTLMAIKYLHSQKIIHRDLKLGNLFIADKMLIKLGDFGLATKIEYEGQRKRTICGTPNYIAPEILEGKNGHSYEVDIWSIGIILYALLVGKPPFESKDVRTTYKKIKSGVFLFPEAVQISECAKNLIKDILVADPTKRPSLDDIMRYEFFQVGTIPKIMPMSTLACPPNLSFIKNFWPDACENGMAYFPCNRKNNYSMQDSMIMQSEYVTNITLRTIHEENLNNKNYQYKIPKRENNYEPIVNNVNNVINVPLPEKIILPHTHHNNQIFVVKNGNDEIYVIRWIDLSSRYGVGYLLSNDSIGVYFNDSTKIVLDPQGKVFHYIEKKGPNKQEVMSVYSLDNHPEEFKKKITLLNRFKKNLQFYDENVDPNIELHSSRTKYKMSNLPKLKSNEFVYVKKWMTTKFAILFRLSNKIIQVCFNDETELILNSNKREVVYSNKEKQRIVYPISNAMNSNNSEMVKRLVYVKDLLNHMLSANSSANVKAANEKKIMMQNVLCSNKNIESGKNIKSELMKQYIKTNKECVIKEENFWR